MALFASKELNSLDDLFVDQLQDLYDAEQRLTDALPKMADAADAEELKTAFTSHLRETEGHITRLEQIFRDLGLEPVREACEAMKGLIKEGSTMVDAKGDSHVKDAALIAAAQRIEHYEMAGYGTARSFANRLGHTHAAQLLQQTLDEEKSADTELTEIAEKSVNAMAGRA